MSYYSDVVNFTDDKWILFKSCFRPSMLDKRLISMGICLSIDAPYRFVAKREEGRVFQFTFQPLLQIFIQPSVKYPY